MWQRLQGRCFLVTIEGQMAFDRDWEGGVIWQRLRRTVVLCRLKGAVIWKRLRKTVVIWWRWGGGDVGERDWEGGW